MKNNNNEDLHAWLEGPELQYTVQVLLIHAFRRITRSPLGTRDGSTTTTTANEQMATTTLSVMAKGPVVNKMAGPQETGPSGVNRVCRASLNRLR